MKAAGLFPDHEYETEGYGVVIVMDPTPVPDGQPNQRKVLVRQGAEQFYILPRLILRPVHRQPERIKVLTRPLRRNESDGQSSDHDGDSTGVRRLTPITVEPSAPLTIDDPRLDALRPSPELVRSYVSRKMANGQTDVEYLMKQWERKENVLLVGDTQGGKTMLVNVLAVHIGEAMGLGKPVPVFTLSASNGITDFDLFGQPTAWTDPATGQERLVWLPGTVDMAARVGGILYLDEVNMMPERVTSSLHPICDWRRSFTNRAKAVKVPGDGFIAETVELSPNLWIVGTMNPNYRGGGALNEAFANRFRHLDWSYDKSVEARLIPNEAVRSLGDALRSARDTGHIRTPIGTAALMRMADDVIEDGVEMALFVLLGMFTLDERAHIEAIIESRSYRTLLANAALGKHPFVGSVPEDWAATDDESPF